jgi:hypothetical protein
LEPIVLRPPIELPAANEPDNAQPSPTGEPVTLNAPPAAGPIDELQPSQPEQIVLGPSRGPLGQIAELINYLGGRVFGALTLIVALSLLAAYPVLQIFALGYLLEAAGRSSIHFLRKQSCSKGCTSSWLCSRRYTYCSRCCVVASFGIIYGHLM